MLKRLKKAIIDNNTLYAWVNPLHQYKEWVFWHLRGKKNSPPHRHKQKILREYQQRHRLGTFVETGTYLGDMIVAMHPEFATLISIELDPQLHERAKRRFKRSSKVKLRQGDSAKELPRILDELKEPALFWLDGHYSGGFTSKAEKETPISEELIAILNHPIKEHVILIDDARCFDGTADYPVLKDLEETLKKEFADWKFEVKDDIIRIHR